LIAHSTVHFDRELKLHLYRDRYGFQPGSDQLNEWANQCLMGEHGHYRNVIKSLYPYFLSTETEPFEMVAGLSPDMVVDILAMEGSEMASGTLKFDDRKVGQMLSATLKQALTNGDGLTRYERQIPKATLMKSQYYRGQVLSDQLGL
jgi:hypothetical protein